MVLQRYDATWVVFECKNYEDLSASDFQQVNYYNSPAGGRFTVIVFRGEVKNHYYQHVKRIVAQNDGMVLLLNDERSTSLCPGRH